MKRSIAVIYGASKAGIKIAIVGLLVMMMAVVVHIVSRSFGYVIIGTYEIVQLTLAVVISFSIFQATLARKHIIIDILVLRLPKRVAVTCYTITQVLSMSTWALVAYIGAKFACDLWLMGETTQMLQVTIFPFRIVFVLSAILVSATFFVQIFEGAKEVVQ